MYKFLMHFVRLKNFVENATDDEDSRLSTYVLKKRVLEDSERSNPKSQKWTYEGHEAMSLYSPLGLISESEVQRAVQFNTVTETDPRESESVTHFVNGLPRKTFSPLWHMNLFLWNYKYRLLLKKTSTRSGFRTVTEYLDYDDYGFYTRVKRSGSVGVSTEQLITYERSQPYINTYVLDKVK